MNKKKIVTGLLSTAFVGGVLLTSTLSADAATYGGRSTGSVSFKSGKLVIPPIDPPIIDPVDPPATDFGLLYVPKEFNFAETTVPTSTVTTVTTIDIDSDWEGNPASDTSGAAESNTATKHFAVGDVRGKRAAGWKLEAKLRADLEDSGTSKTLTGATITMSQGINELTPTTWVETPTTAGAGANTPDVVPSSVTLSTTSSTIMSAAAESNPGDADGRGEGYWQGEFTNIELNVPATPMNQVAAGEQYTGYIDWTLTDSI